MSVYGNKLFIAYLSLYLFTYLYITHMSNIRHFKLQMAAFSLARPTFGRVHVSYKVLQTFGKSTVHLQGLVIFFHPNFIYIQIGNFAEKSFCVERQLVTESKKDFWSLKMFQRSR